jgi:catechol 2,3-dioxygenase-like lactoylglutathione lyase family enzyme
MLLGNVDATATLAVKDLGAAKKFYQEKLGLTPVDDSEELVVFKSGNTTINVYHSEYAGTNQATALTWEVDDVEQEVRELKSKGIHFEHYDGLHGLKRQGDVHIGEGVKVAWFKDPDGNILNLISE